MRRFVTLVLAAAVLFCVVDGCKKKKKTIYVVSSGSISGEVWVNLIDPTTGNYIGGDALWQTGPWVRLSVYVTAHGATYGGDGVGFSASVGYAEIINDCIGSDSGTPSTAFRISGLAPGTYSLEFSAFNLWPYIEVDSSEWSLIPKWVSLVGSVPIEVVANQETNVGPVTMYIERAR